MLRHTFRIAGILLMIILFLSSPVYAKEDSMEFKLALPDSVNQGTWLWNTRMINDDSSGIFSYMEKEKFNELYLQIDPDIAEENYRKFIKTASIQKIGVYALDGNSSWATHEGRMQVKSFFQWVEKYNQSSRNEQKFVGVHLDVEPYLNQMWREDIGRAVSEYQDYFLYAVQEAKRQNLKFACDVPFWFDEIQFNNDNGKGNLAEWVIKNGEDTVVMAYRDKAEGEGNIIQITENEMAWAKNYHKKLFIAVETGKSAEGSYVTFYGKGKKTLFSELKKVYYYYSENEYKLNFAVHDLSNLRKLS